MSSAQAPGSRRTAVSPPESTGLCPADYVKSRAGSSGHCSPSAPFPPVAGVLTITKAGKAAVALRNNTGQGKKNSGSEICQLDHVIFGQVTVFSKKQFSDLENSIIMVFWCVTFHLWKPWWTGWCFLSHLGGSEVWHCHPGHEGRCAAALPQVPRLASSPPHTECAETLTLDLLARSPGDSDSCKSL